MIKFYNLKKIDKKIHIKIIKNIQKVLKKGNYILGNQVNEFEKKFSRFVGTNYAVGCGNGTDAITLALNSLNLRKGSEVIIPAMTYCSTAFAVINSGLKPVLVDLSNNSSLIDINKIKKKINNKTKVIIPVHLYGSVVNIDEIKKITRLYKNKIYIIDDCAQAHGAYLEKTKTNKKVGSLSDISCFSFYPGKNLGAYGDAGIITTNSKKFYKSIKKLRNLGSDKKFIHENIGMNSRLDTIQAVVLKEKIKYLESLNKKRRVVAKYYNNFINNKKIKKIIYSNGSVYHQYVILAKNRSKLTRLLKINKIDYSFHYPYAIHQLHALKKMFKNQRYINAEKIASEGVSLPIDPNLKSHEIRKIAKIINSF